MEIQTAFNSGIQGLQKATEASEQAAADIVASTQASQDTDLANIQTATTEQKIPELNQSIVDLKVAEHQAKAATELIKTADDSLGTLLDVTA